MCYTFIIDLDGTLLNINGELLPDVCDYLVRIQERGHKVVIATGRKYLEAEKLIKQLRIKEHKNAAILSDGQYLIDYLDDTKIEEQFLSYPDDCKKIISYFDKKPEAVRLIAKDADYDVFPSVFGVAMLKHFCGAAMKFKNPFQGLIVYSKRKIDNIEKMTVGPYTINEDLRNNVRDHYQVSFCKEKKRYEFKAKAVNKCEMLKKYISKYDILEDQIFVFGNDENDLPLFEYFSNSFVVDTAKEAVKIRAREIIAYREGRGVIEKIKAIVEERKL